jgi:hypothetical protein
MNAEDQAAFIRDPDNQNIIQTIIKLLFPIDAEGRVRVRDRKMASDVTLILAKALMEIYALKSIPAEAKTEV